MAAEQKAEQKPPALIVYVLFRETNTGDGEESDGYIEAIYATREQADEARLAAIREARDEGADIWCDPDDPDDDGNVQWEVDWRVEEHQVIGAIPLLIGGAP